MEGLAPPFQLLIHVRRQIERGLSLKGGIISYLKTTEDDFSPKVSYWLSLVEKKEATGPFLNQIESVYRKELLRILERGLAGAPILHILRLFEEEVILACENEIQNKLTDLPYLAMIPLLLLQFPAFLLLLLGPLLIQLLDSLSS
jgi:hypothetical protein